MRASTPCVRGERGEGEREGEAAGRCVDTHLWVLRACGYCRLPPASSTSVTGTSVASTTRYHRLHEVYRGYTLALTVAYLLQECFYAYQVRRELEALSRVLFLLLCHVTSLGKQLVFLARGAELDALLARLRGLRAAAGGAARRWRRFVRAYAGCAALTCALWGGGLALRRARAEPGDLPLWTPLRHEHTAGFTLALLYSYYVTTLVGVANTTMDAFVAAVLDQCKIQLRILRMKFEKLTEIARDDVRKNVDEHYEEVLRKLFLECLKHHDEITKTTKLLQDIFGTSILIQFAIGGWILCMAAYKIVNLNILSIDFMSMILFTSCILTELFLYCYFGNEVTVESERLADSMYAMRWETTSVKFRRLLLVARERARRPLRPAAGRVVPLSLDTFLKIIKSSYTFYAVLRQTK